MSIQIFFLSPLSQYDTQTVHVVLGTDILYAEFPPRFLHCMLPFVASGHRVDQAITRVGPIPFFFNKEDLQFSCRFTLSTTEKK